MVSFTMRSILSSLVVSAVLLMHHADAGEDTHVYAPDEDVTLWLNKIGPYHNPQETYTYYTLPFCKPDGEYHKQIKYAGIGEVLEGTELVHSAMHMKFGVNTPKTPICNQVLTEDNAQTFRYAVSQHYWYQMYLDDLPVWGMVGIVVGTDEELQAMEAAHEHEHQVRDAFIYTSKKFTIAYNGQQIIQVNLTSDDPIEVKPGASVEFSYSVTWVKTDQPFDQRFNRYLDYSFFEHQIHWFSIFNSFMMVIFLCGLVTLILLRALRNDYAKYTQDDVELESLDKGFGDELGNDSGWKQIRGDVFRRPDHLVLFSAIRGAGFQIVSLVFCVVLLAIMGSLYVDRGALVTASLVSYALTSIVAGYASGSHYNQYFHPNPAPMWIRTMVLTAMFFPVCCFIVASSLNLIAIYYQTINVIPIGTFMIIILIWLLVALPLTVLGTVLGRHWSGESNFPCRANAIPGPIPERSWYAKPVTIILLTGVLPFGSIFIEMYFIFTSFWNYKFYYVYGFMLLVFIILIIVSICVTIVATYFLLNSEDYRWNWISYLASGSTALYVYMYSIYYFFVKTSMTGFLQTCFYFGYMGLFCLALFLMCGSVGNLGATLFVKKIYRNIKVD